MIHDFCVEFDFPAEAIETLDAAYAQILANREAFELLVQAMDAMYRGTDNAFLELLEKSAALSGVHRYTSDLIFWIMCAVPLRYIYRAKQIPEEVYRDSMLDLRHKLFECRNVYGIWGVFSTWFASFYRLTRFGFGRLEYDVAAWQDGDYKGMLTDGDLVFRCHIPSSGPLYPELVTDSFRKLHTHFKDRLKDGILAVRCETWLLYPPIIALCAPESNMRKFYDLFDLFSERRSDSPYADLWRIFNRKVASADELADLPADTSFRRAMRDYLLAGGVMGRAAGVVLFDGEKILRK